jgi:hypothetical protein
MTLLSVTLWGVIVLSYVLGYCTGVLVKQRSLAAVASAIEYAGHPLDRPENQSYYDLRHALHERNLAWWTAEGERTQMAIQPRVQR